MKKMILIIGSIIYFVLLFAVASEMSAAITVTPHYFEYNGEPIFLLGLGNWIFINKIDVDYIVHNQWYESYGINYNRITLTSTWYTDTLIQVFPWKRSTVPGANDGGNKFDLNEMDTTFWDRLHGYLQDCENRGIIVCIQFFDECAVEHGSDPHRWDYHPFNPQNNINNIPDLNTYDASYSSSTGWSQSFYNVDNTVLMTLQDIYVEKLLDETNQYGNIIYEMANEYGGEGNTQFPGHFAWPQHWIDYFSDYETINDVELLLTNMPFGVDYDQAEYFASSGIECIDAYRQFPSYDDIQGVNDFLEAHYNENKPIFGGKIGNDIGNGGNVDDNRKRLWTLFVSGGAGSGLKGGDSANWLNDTTMEAMLSNIHTFIESDVEFWNMVPVDSLVISGTAYCLANIGEEYVIYLPNGGSVTVDLSVVADTLYVGWYDPKDGTYTYEEPVAGGGTVMFTPPFSDDAVLHLLKSGNPGVEQEIAPLLKKHVFFQVYPNPFREKVEIKFRMTENRGQNPENRNNESDISIRIFDVTGRKVREFILYPSSFILPAKLEWDGKDFRNQRCPIGIYFCRFEVENIVEIKKLLLVR